MKSQGTICNAPQGFASLLEAAEAGSSEPQNGQRPCAFKLNLLQMPITSSPGTAYRYCAIMTKSRHGNDSKSIDPDPQHGNDKRQNKDRT